MIEMVRERYGIETEIVRPDAQEVMRLIAPKGPDLFYESVEARRGDGTARRESDATDQSGEGSVTGSHHSISLSGDTPHDSIGAYQLSTLWQKCRDVR